ncbi:MAG: helix-turn-helix transcriptional regulator [Candidatus Eremiobacteraeota bacterium]|nr:helix-turn-helix transcriptional regulator [Candidatus Eremiobacteraeota bacterium]
MQTSEAGRSDRGLPKNFMRPCVLLLLKESSAHGYDLLERIRAFGLKSDAGGMYRLLRALEREGFVRSWWEAGDNGHDRRTYALTAFGEKSLSAWGRSLAQSRVVLEMFARRLGRTRSGVRLLEPVT